MTNNSSAPPNVFPALQTLMSDIFEHGESLPDAVYKDMLENCVAVQRTIDGLARETARAWAGGDGEIWRRRHEALYNTFHRVNGDFDALKRRHKRVDEENKRLLKRIEDVAVPALPCGPSVCCFKGLQAAFARDPSIAAKTARCGCCHVNYPIGYGGQNFRSEAQKHHRETCGHTFKHCELCKRQIRRDRAARGLPDPDTGVPYASSRL